MIDSDVLNNDVTLTGVMEDKKKLGLTIYSRDEKDLHKDYDLFQGDLFVVPQCPFSAVTNYKFKNYSANNRYYNVGDEIIMTKNSYLNCQWTYVPPTNGCTISVRHIPKKGSGTIDKMLLERRYGAGTFKDKRVAIRIVNEKVNGYEFDFFLESTVLPEEVTDLNYWPQVYLGGKINYLELLNAPKGSVLQRKPVVYNSLDEAVVTFNI